MESAAPAFVERLKSLLALGEERTLKRLVCVSLDRRARTIAAVQILPCRAFLDALWAGEFRG